MIFQAKSSHFLSVKCDCLVLPVYDEKSLTGAVDELDKASDGLLSKLKSQGEIGGAFGDTTLLFSVFGTKATRVLLVNAGKRDSEMSAEKFDKLISNCSSAINKTKAKDVAVFLSDITVSDRDHVWQARQTAKLFSASLYNYSQTKSEPSKPSPLRKGVFLTETSGQVKALSQALAEGSAIAEGMALTRELGNLPGNICTPKYLSTQARRLARSETKLTTKVLGEKQMRDLGMGSLLSVAHGSDEEAQLIAMEYKGGKKSDKPVVLVGKGITFDTGGISLKPGAAMDEMKFDMCGAATVFGVMAALVAMQLPINVVGIVAAAENMPSGRATKPGDIVTSMSGKTIEILNTDAEGRLVLCDALTFAGRYKPKAVIDIATLTGAIVVGLGKAATGLFANDDELASDLLSAGLKAGDKAWQMPLWDEYQDLLKSNFADIANIGGPHGGAITAACFLSRFTEDYTWAHLDIAGVAWVSGAQKGATGRPVAMLVEYLKSQV